MINFIKKKKKKNNNKLLVLINIVNDLLFLNSCFLTKKIQYNQYK